MSGGDPSINCIVALNELNSTLEEAKLYPQSVYTGYADIAKTRQYKTLNNKTYMTFNKTWYDGYKIMSEF